MSKTLFVFGEPLESGIRVGCCAISDYGTTRVNDGHAEVTSGGVYFHHATEENQESATHQLIEWWGPRWNPNSLDWGEWSIESRLAETLERFREEAVGWRGGGITSRHQFLFSKEQADELFAYSNGDGRQSGSLCHY
jgi:hypothetical protein